MLNVFQIEDRNTLKSILNTKYSFTNVFKVQNTIPCSILHSKVQNKSIQA